MALTPDQRAEVRRLHDAGMRWQVIAELLDVSRSVIHNLTDTPPSDEEMAEGESLLAEIRAEIAAAEDVFGCYRGDKAVFMREIFGDSPFGPPELGSTAADPVGEPAS